MSSPPTSPLTAAELRDVSIEMLTIAADSWRRSRRALAVIIGLAYAHGVDRQDILDATGLSPEAAAELLDDSLTAVKDTLAAKDGE